MTGTSKQELATSQTVQTIKPYLELDVKHLAEKTPKFTQALDTFLSSNLDDPTRLKVSNLRLMVQFLRMDYERIDELLQRLEPEESQTF